MPSGEANDKEKKRQRTKSIRSDPEKFQQNGNNGFTLGKYRGSTWIKWVDCATVQRKLGKVGRLSISLVYLLLVA